MRTNTRTVSTRPSSFRLWRPGIEASQWYTLQASSANINPLSLPEVLVDLSASNAVDANAIKKLTSLATSPSDTQ